MNRKADEWLSPYMILIWVLVAGVIFAGVSLFYSAKIDIKAEEADALSSKLVRCVVENGYIIENFDINNCGLDIKLIKNSENFYYRVSIKDLTTNIAKEVAKEGNPDFEIQCQLKEKSKAENFASCSNKKVYALNSSGSGFIVEIFTGSNQIGGINA